MLGIFVEVHKGCEGIFLLNERDEIVCSFCSVHLHYCPECGKKMYLEKHLMAGRCACGTYYNPVDFKVIEFSSNDEDKYFNHPVPT
ncbi:hypothetical protein C0583_00835 [Candidatus Parcubacteria bacterium]|nr:MAG: hypothetical protein C0583_00835 [Candidatus Parcubacteria bacterium]